MHSDNMGTSVLPQRQENAGFAAVVARGGGPATGSISRRGRPVPGLPQRQENAGSAAVVARGGGQGCHGKHLPQGTASSGASATAGKCGFRCRCGKGRRTGMPQGTGNRSGNMERRYFMVIPPEGPPTAASPKPSIRRRAQPEYSSGTQQPPRQQ